MKKQNKKGFTLVELVIVIAVIAILAAVLIPTFTTVIGNANKSAAEQEAANLKTEILALYQGNFDEYCYKQMDSSSSSSSARQIPATGTGPTETLANAKIDKNDTTDDAPIFADFITVKDIKTTGSGDWVGIKISATEKEDTYEVGSGKVEYKVGNYYVTITAKGVEVTTTKPSAS